MNSGLYDCRVVHERREVLRRRFNYRVFYLWLDLDELAAVNQRSWLLGVDRTAPYSFREADHWPTGGGCLKQRVLSWLTARGVEVPGDAVVRLLAIPRTLGYVFNPISFYFVFDREGVATASVAEVRNTFGETKLYLLERSPEDRGRLFTACLPKAFYVSPFFDTELKFRFRFRVPGEVVDLRVDDLRGGEVVFKSALSGRRVELSSANLLRLSLACPVVTMKVIFLIHWHAFVLWVRRVPWLAKSARPDAQLDVLNPHHSITQNS